MFRGSSTFGTGSGELMLHKNSTFGTLQFKWTDNKQSWNPGYFQLSWASLLSSPSDRPTDRPPVCGLLGILPSDLHRIQENLDGAR